jgi:hypothetical protein
VQELHQRLVRVGGGPYRGVRKQELAEAVVVIGAGRRSSAASANNRLNVAFSRLRSFNRFAASTFNPPNWLRHR